MAHTILLSLLLVALHALEPNPPNWPSSVSIFSPSDSNTSIAQKVLAAFSVNGGHNPPNQGQFATGRFAFLFKPGEYDVEVPVGYYTTIHGLGDHPSDAIFTSEKGVYSEEGDYTFQGGALCTFWRSAENFQTQATWANTAGPGMLWAVSQATPLRRIVVDHHLTLYEYQPPATLAGYSSGGYFSNLQVGHSARNASVTPLDFQDGTVNLGSQQQWFARNSEVGEWNGGVWNVVLSGVTGAPSSHCSNTNGLPITVVPQTPVVSEKPYITIDAGGKYHLVIPGLKRDSAGVDFDSAGTVVDFSQVYVATPKDSAKVINAKLSQQLHVVLSPGIYQIDEPLMLMHKGQVLLGLGMATLVSSAANAVIQVGNVDAVRICSLIVQAGPLVNGKMAHALIQFGDGSYSGNSNAPSFMHDVFARVGGPDGSTQSVVAAESMVRVDTGNVIGDNMWFWRADHSAAGPTSRTTNFCQNGLVVTGDDVIMYGLAVEHTLGDLVQWSGENGRTYFYQSELPYKVTHAEFGVPGYVGYRVNDTVSSHSAWGLGVYSNFVVDSVIVESGIKSPPALEKNFVAAMGVHLNGEGEVKHVLNNIGNGTGKAQQVNYVC